MPVRVCYCNRFHLRVIRVAGHATIRQGDATYFVEHCVSGCDGSASLVHRLGEVSFPVIGAGPLAPIRVHNPSHPAFGGVFDCGHIPYGVDHLCHQPPHIPRD